MVSLPNCPHRMWDRIALVIPLVLSRTCCRTFLPRSRREAPAGAPGKTTPLSVESLLGLVGPAWAARRRGRAPDQTRQDPLPEKPETAIGPQCLGILGVP